MVTNKGKIISASLLLCSGNVSIAIVLTAYERTGLISLQAHSHIREDYETWGSVLISLHL
jgi:hypothetical protein